MKKIVYLMDYFSFYKRFIRPHSLEEIEQIAHKLRYQKAVYVDFSRLNTAAELKMLYFLSGVAYVLNGSVTQVSPSKYIFSK